MIGACPSAELLTLVHELSAIAGLPGPADRPESCDWNAWFELADGNQLAALLGSRTASGENPSRHATRRPLAIQNRLRAAYIYGAREAAFLHRELQRILAVLRDVADPIALKGSALAYALYDHPSERPMWDIDLLLSREEASLGFSILQEHGYEAACPPWEHHHLPPLRHPVREITVELHTNLATPFLPEALIERMRRETRSVPLADGSEMRILDPPARLIHQAIHALRNPIGSPFLRNLFEVAWIAARMDVAEMQRAFELSRHAEIEGQVVTACALAEQLFGRVHGIPAPPPGAVQYWCTRRLNWANGRPEDANRWSRLRTAIAHRHLVVARRGASDRSPSALLGALFASSAASGKRKRRASGARLQRARTKAAEVGGSLLVENLETGEVHLLSGNAVEAWRCARDGTRRRELARALRRSGLNRRESREAVGALYRCGLLA
jgi:hypothetical protein